MESTDIRIYKHLPNPSLECEITGTSTSVIHLRRPPCRSKRKVLSTYQFTQRCIGWNYHLVQGGRECDFKIRRNYSVGGLWSRWKRLWYSTLSSRITTRLRLWDLTPVVRYTGTGAHAQSWSLWDISSARGIWHWRSQIAHKPFDRAFGALGIFGRPHVRFYVDIEETWKLMENSAQGKPAISSPIRRIPTPFDR